LAVPFPFIHLHTAHGRPTVACKSSGAMRTWLRVLVRPQQASGFKTHNSSHHSHAIASLLTQLASAKLQQSHYAFGKVLEELQF
jgi:hypothetical protein